MFEERAQQFLLNPRLPQRSADSFRQAACVLRDVVCQVNIFRAVPHLFIGIEFRGISRQPFDTQSSREPLSQSNTGAAMNHPAVPHQDNTFRKMLKQTGHERLGIDGIDVVVEELKVKSQSSGLSRDGDCRYGRDSLTPVPTVLNRRPAFGRPSAAYRWLEHKAAFVSKNDGFRRPSGVFLYWASRFFARSLWPVRRVRGRDARVSDNSSPFAQARARRRTDRNGRQKFVVSVPQSEAKSTNRWQIHVGSAPPKAASPAASIVESLASALGQGGFWPLTLPDHRDDRLLPIARPPLVLRQVGLPPRLVKTAVPAASWLVADAAPLPCVRVLLPYKMLSAKSICISNLFKSQ